MRRLSNEVNGYAARANLYHVLSETMFRFFFCLRERGKTIRYSWFGT